MKWKKITDKMPDPWRTTLLFRPEKGAGEDQIWWGFFSPTKMAFISSEHREDLKGITHWMELPEPPEEYSEK